MAVLWRSMENKGVIDARYREDSDASPSLTGKVSQKNTFLEKHLRICDPLPSEIDMKAIVKQVSDDRQKSKNSTVPSVTGVTDKTKKDLYGSLKPGANTTLFIGLAGFQETNAWIEKNVTASTHAEVPILGNGVVVTYDRTTSTYSVVKSGKLKLSIAVGNEASFTPNEESTLTGQLTMQSKVVYHFGGLA